MTVTWYISNNPWPNVQKKNQTHENMSNLKYCLVDYLISLFFTGE